ncbi:hypothetical protein RISK_002338 [Rhodopirellula islandica]|uniref:Uncharacterized protein n=1 Tax=Rhodopirellula islandica TaxID=595434 RepID=A0A0J1BGP7_RHOIS|nr:hypothetical protein RISK_002338 [Rhodopirellula islandica]
MSRASNGATVEQDSSRAGKAVSLPWQCCSMCLSTGGLSVSTEIEQG